MISFIQTDFRNSILLTRNKKRMQLIHEDIHETRLKLEMEFPSNVSLDHMSCCCSCYKHVNSLTN